MKKYRKTIFILAILTGVTTLNILARDKQEKHEFKNLQVYPKDVSEEKLDRDMHLFSRSLGVKCNFCHVRGEDGKMDFASDKNGHKDIARDMMRMTQDLNVRYFKVDTLTAKETDYAINCYTCHRGEEEPIVPWDTAHVKPLHPEREHGPRPPFSPKLDSASH